ncbi:hypothetical protein ACFE04_010175 [Oxalis oulophora]
MAEDQSVIGRKCIYYDHCESETMICSDDNDEEFLEPGEEEHEFSKEIVQEHGEDDDVLNSVNHNIGLYAEEIKIYKSGISHSERNTGIKSPKPSIVAYL